MASINTNLSAVQVALTGRTNISPLAEALSSSSVAKAGTNPGTQSSLTISGASTISALSRQRYTANAHLAQSALETVQQAAKNISDKLDVLRKLAVRASDDSLANSERNIINAKYQVTLSSLNTLISQSKWDGQRLFDGTGGAKHNGVLSFQVGDNRTIDIALPNLKKASVRMNTSELVKGSLGPGVREIQAIDLGSATIADRTAELSFNGITLSSGALGTSASIDDLVAALTSDADYANAVFTVTGDGGTKLLITGKSSIDISGVASLTLTKNPSVIDSIVTTGGASAETISGTTEQQSISITASDIQSKTVTLTVGSTVLSAGTLGSAATLDDLIAGLQSDADYSGAGFTVAKNGSSGVLLQWSSAGAVTDLGVLSLTGSSSSSTASQAVAGVTGSNQYETYALSSSDTHISGGTLWGLATSGAVKTTTGPLAFDGTVSDLVSKINSSSASTYVTATADTAGMKLTWNASGAHDPFNLFIYNPTDGLYSVTYSGTTTQAVDSAYEQQEFSLNTFDIQGKPITITFSGTSYTTSTLSSTATMADLVSALNTAASGAPFTVSEITSQNTSASTGYTSGIRLTWNSAGSVATTGTAEQQTFQISATDLRNADKVTLTYGSDSFTAQLPYGATTTWWSKQTNLNSLSDAVSGLNTQISQAASSPGFAVSADTSNGLTLVWAAAGNQTGTASLTIARSAQTADYTGNTVWNFGGWLYPEVHQSWSYIDTAGLSGYSADLVFGSTVLSAGPLTGSETNSDGNMAGYEMYQQLASGFSTDADFSAISGNPTITYDPWVYGAALTMDWTAQQTTFPAAYIDFYRNVAATETVTGTTGTTQLATMTLLASSTSITASETTTGSAATRTSAVSEIQEVSVTASAIQGKNVTLHWGTLSSADISMASDATVDDLLSSLVADSGYGDMPFTLTSSVSGANGDATDTLILSWGSSGAVNQNAYLSISDPSQVSTVSSAESVKGEEPSVTGGLSEVQRIYIRPSTIAGNNLRLSVGDFSVYSGLMEEGASLSDLTFGFVSNPSYDRAPFTISQQGSYLTLNWKVAGPVTQTAQLQSNAASAFTSYLKKGNLLSREASLSALSGLNYAQNSLSDLQVSLQPVSASLSAAIDQLSADQNGAASGPTYSAGLATALVGLLQTQFASDPAKSAMAQANFTPGAVINTLK